MRAEREREKDREREIKVTLGFYFSQRSVHTIEKSHSHQWAPSRASVRLRRSKKALCVEVMVPVHGTSHSHTHRHTHTQSCQMNCWGFCGAAAAAEARFLAASLAFPDASFTASLSSHWGVSPVRWKERQSEDNGAVSLSHFHTQTFVTFIELVKWFLHECSFF